MKYGYVASFHDHLVFEYILWKLVDDIGVYSGQNPSLENFPLLLNIEPRRSLSSESNFCKVNLRSNYFCESGSIMTMRMMIFDDEKKERMTSPSVFRRGLDISKIPRYLLVTRVACTNFAIIDNSVVRELGGPRGP